MGPVGLLKKSLSFERQYSALGGSRRNVRFTAFWMPQLESGCLAQGFFNSPTGAVFSCCYLPRLTGPCAQFAGWTVLEAEQNGDRPR